MNRVKSLLVLKLSHDTILYTLNYTILYYTILYYSILFYAILYCSILFYTIYYTIIPLESPKKKSLDVCRWYLQPSSVTPSDDQEVVCGNARDTRGGLRRLVVYKPQLGWWHSQLNGKIKFMFQTTNQLFIKFMIWICIKSWHIHIIIIQTKNTID